MNTLDSLVKKYGFGTTFYYILDSGRRYNFTPYYIGGCGNYYYGPSDSKDVDANNICIEKWHIDKNTKDFIENNTKFVGENAFDFKTDYPITEEVPAKHETKTKEEKEADTEKMAKMVLAKIGLLLIDYIAEDILECKYDV